MENDIERGTITCPRCGNTQSQRGAKIIAQGIMHACLPCNLQLFALKEDIGRDGVIGMEWSTFYARMNKPPAGKGIGQATARQGAGTKADEGENPLLMDARLRTAASIVSAHVDSNSKRDTHAGSENVLLRDARARAERAKAGNLQDDQNLLLADARQRAASLKDERREA